MTTLATSQLAELISRKHQVLVRLRDVGLQQIELVNQGDVAALLKTLAAKQHLIVNLQDVERELTPFRDEDPETRAWSTPAARAQCARLAAECNELLSEVVYLEKQSEDKMVARRDQVADQLQQIYSAGQARGAYAAQQTGPTPRSATIATCNSDTAGSATGATNAGGLDLVAGR